MSVTEANAEKASANNVGVISGCGGGTVVAGGDLSNFFPSFDYFSNVDPRTMRRIGMRLILILNNNNWPQPC